MEDTVLICVVLVLATLQWLLVGWLAYTLLRHGIKRSGRWTVASRLFCLTLAALGPLGLAFTALMKLFDWMESNLDWAGEDAGW